MSTQSRSSARVALVALALLACGGTATIGCSGEPVDECTGATNDALRTCAAGATLKGIDVSYYQGTVNWTAVKGAGQAFAFARVSGAGVFCSAATSDFGRVLGLCSMFMRSNR